LGISGALTTASRSQSGQVPVVATFSVLADLVREVGSGRVSVTSLVGPNADAHVYQPTPSDAQRVAEARIIFVNGLGFEGWMTRLIKASGAKAAVVVASRGVKPIEAEAEDHGHSGGGAHPADPHAWQNVANVKLYVAAIRDGLIQADPGSKETYQANASRYLAALDQLESEVRAAINRIPPNRRRIITTHDAFGYFAKAYGLQFIAAQGVSTEAEASAKDVAKIIRQIRAQKVPAVFLENISDPRMMERIAKESGARIGDKVYSDALSEPGGPAGTYIDMMRHNIHAFSAALTS
jgi:zinc/manganese transport system substrate-binding protein